MTPRYYAPTGGLPGQTELTTDRAVFTEAYAVLPRGTMRDIVTSALPFWEKTRLWIIARPLSGFAETFSQYIVEVSPGGGSDRPELDPSAEGVLFVVDGAVTVVLEGETHELGPGGYAFIPPGSDWTLRNAERRRGALPLDPQGLRARRGHRGARRPSSPARPPSTERRCPAREGRWTTQRFVDPLDVRHDMHVNIVNFEPGGVIPFPETHVMEHGLYVLEGKAVYLLNNDWVEVQEGDFMWLRAFCPQACYAGGPGRFRYLLYKDVNRHAKLGRQFL